MKTGLQIFIKNYRHATRLQRKAQTKTFDQLPLAGYQSPIGATDNSPG
jgi:hypothetical protein